MTFPTPHREKLLATLHNDKLPKTDVPRLEAAIQRYEKWIADLEAVDGTPKSIISRSVTLLNEYALYINLDLIFDSPNDFLYRQKGQLKLDNSIVEEFLPWLSRPSVLPELADNFSIGPTKCYSSMYFESTLAHQLAGAGLRIRTKDQDFAISRRLHIQASHSIDFESAEKVETQIAYVATEIKTNLDKTMFQEACATARDIRSAVPGARYFLMVEWLDMSPISTAPTDIEQVLLLRGAKRMNSNQRKPYSSAQGRREHRAQYVDYLRSNPFRADVFERWLSQVQALLADTIPEESNVLEQGFF